MLSRLKFDISSIVADIYSKIPQEVFESNVTTFVDVQAAGLQFIIPLVEILRKKGHSDDNIRSRVYAYAENDLYLNYVMFKYKDLPITYKIYNEKNNMKFDVVLGNPPYQKKVGPKKTQSIWPKFVEKSFEICKEGGYVSLIHPSGWRDVKGDFKDTQKIMLSKNVLHLVMCNTKKGLETFGVNTNFDWYLIKNNNNQGLTHVIDYNNNVYDIDLSDVEYIPNSDINLVLSLVAKESEEKVNIISDSSYHTQRSFMSKVRTDDHIYPCAYTIGSLNPNFWYSNINKGHIGIPKVIWGNGLTDVIVDIDGIYGLTQFCYAIVDEPENLELIKNVLKSNFFIKNIMGYTKGVGHIYNRKIIGTFKKDFWKDFLDENNNVIEPNFENVEQV